MPVVEGSHSRELHAERQGGETDESTVRVAIDDQCISVTVFEGCAPPTVTMEAVEASDAVQVPITPKSEAAKDQERAKRRHARRKYSHKRKGKPPTTTGAVFMRHALGHAWGVDGYLDQEARTSPEALIRQWATYKRWKGDDYALAQLAACEAEALRFAAELVEFGKAPGLKANRRLVRDFADWCAKQTHTTIPTNRDAAGTRKISSSRKPKINNDRSA